MLLVCRYAITYANIHTQCRVKLSAAPYRSSCRTPCVFDLPAGAAGKFAAVWTAWAHIAPHPPAGHRKTKAGVVLAPGNQDPGGCSAVARAKSGYQKTL